jgi:hypothetical protein
MQPLSHMTVLGTYPVQDGFRKLEFQIERRLIWIRLRAEDDDRVSLWKADELLPNAWEAIERVIDFAEEQSRQLIPNFWSAHDASKMSGHRLDVWSIALTPEDGSIEYYVSRNHDFFGDMQRVGSLPPLPAHHHVRVMLARSGELTHAMV